MRALVCVGFTLALALAATPLFAQDKKSDAGTPLPWNPFASAKEGDWEATVIKITGNRRHPAAIHTTLRVKKVAGGVATLAVESRLEGGTGTRSLADVMRPTGEISLELFAELGTAKPEGLKLDEEKKAVAGRDFPCTRLSYGTKRVVTRKGGEKDDVASQTTLWLSKEVRVTGRVAVVIEAEITSGGGESEKETIAIELVGFGNGDRVDWGKKPEGVKLEGDGEVRARLEELNRKREWETFTIEVENQKLNARSQLASARARLKDRDPAGALVDLREGLRILDDLPALAAEVKRSKDAAAKHLVAQKPELAALSRELHRELGNAWQAKGTPADLAEALKAYETALAHDATSKDALDVHVAIAKVLARTGPVEKALERLAKVLEKDGKHAAALLARAQLHDDRGQHEKAIADTSLVLESDAGNREALIARGGSFLALRRHAKALADFEAVIARKDDDPRAFIGRGRAKQALGDHAAAIEDLSEAIDLNPAAPDGYFHRGEAYCAQRKLAEAIKDYEVAILRDPQFHAGRLGLARALEWALESDRAAQILDDVLKADDAAARAARPQALAAKAALLAARAQKVEVLADVEQKLREENAEKDGSPGPRPALAELTARAETERRTREKGARALYDEALALAPKLVVALVGRARLALQLGEAEPAKRDLAAAEAALEGGTPALAEVHALRGRVALLAGASGAAEAVKRFEAALAADRDCAFALSGLGLALAGGKDAARARASFEKARALAVAKGEPGKGERHVDEELYFFQEGLKQADLADRSLKRELYARARQSFARAIARDPHHALAHLERARLAVRWKAWDLALEDATSAIAADPFLADAYELRGLLLARDLPEAKDPRTQRPVALRDREKAVLDFTKALELGSSPEAAAAARYGRALARTGLPPTKDARALEQGVADVEAAIRTIPAELGPWIASDATAPDRVTQARESCLLLERLLAAQGKTADAARARERAAAIGDEAKAAARKTLDGARALRDRRSYVEAIARLDRVVALDPQLAEAWNDRGTCHLKTGSFVPGLLDLARAAEQSAPHGEQLYNKLLQVAYVVDLDRVIAELGRLIADHDDVAAVFFLRGFFHVAKAELKRVDGKDLEAGIRDLTRTLALRPSHPQAHLYLGTLHLRVGQNATAAQARDKAYALALASFESGKKTSPEDGRANYLIARLWSTRAQENELDPAEKTRRLDRACEELRIAIEEKKFTGYGQLKDEKGFEAVRDDPRAQRLLRFRPR